MRTLALFFACFALGGTIAVAGTVACFDHLQNNLVISYGRVLDHALSVGVEIEVLRKMASAKNPFLFPIPESPAEVKIAEALAALEKMTQADQREALLKLLDEKIGKTDETTHIAKTVKNEVHLHSQDRVQLANGKGIDRYLQVPEAGPMRGFGSDGTITTWDPDSFQHIKTVHAILPSADAKFIPLPYGDTALMLFGEGNFHLHSTETGELRSFGKIKWHPLATEFNDPRKYKGQKLRKLLGMSVKKVEELPVKILTEHAFAVRGTDLFVVPMDQTTTVSYKNTKADRPDGNYHHASQIHLFRSGELQATILMPHHRIHRMLPMDGGKKLFLQYDTPYIKFSVLDIENLSGVQHIDDVQKMNLDLTYFPEQHEENMVVVGPNLDRIVTVVSYQNSSLIDTFRLGSNKFSSVDSRLLGSSAFSQDGKYVARFDAFGKGIGAVLDTETGTVVGTFGVQAEKGEIHHKISFSPDGKSILGFEILKDKSRIPVVMPIQFDGGE